MLHRKVTERGGSCSAPDALSCTVRAAFAAAILFLPSAPAIRAAGPPAEILGCMERAGEENRILTQAYTSARIYKAENGRLNKAATVSAEITYTPPGDKDFRILNQTGSGVVQKRVIQPALEEERRNSQASTRAQTDIHRRNYDFEFLEFDPEADANVFQATPKSRNRHLFRGKIWVDSASCGVVRIEGEPAVSPSFWIRKTVFRHDYARVGGVWLPVGHHTEVQLRLFGRATFDIEYGRYSFDPPPQTAARAPRQPDAE